MQGKIISQVLILASAFMVFAADAASITVPMYLVTNNGKGRSIGTVKIEDSICGVLITPDLHHLPPGLHGFHVHENPLCGNKGMAAGGHLDPGKTGEHDGPYSRKGHLGDLPVLIVNEDGEATIPTIAPKFRVATIRGHALIIHEQGDNYSDHPEKLGGGGDRIACGVIDNEKS